MMAFLTLPIAFGIEARPLVAGVLLGLFILHMLLGTAFGPGVPINVAGTLSEYIYPKFLHGFVANGAEGMNWGRMLGLHGHWSLLPVLAVWITTAFIARVYIAQAPSAVPRRPRTTSVPAYVD